MILTCSQWLNYEGRRSTWSSRKVSIEGAFGRHATTNHGSNMQAELCQFWYDFEFIRYRVNRV